MVTFVSQCEKKALTRTRRVLDAFANRIGDNTWQTVITQEGLLAVKKLLRKTATKNTAVSCHWIRSRKRSELVWVVGNRGKFNCEGVVPVNSTKRNLLKLNIENDWKYLPLIKALTAMSALLHDWGKASELFQDKLNPKKKTKLKGDPLRHEWISCLLLNALVTQFCDENNQQDKDWLMPLQKGMINEESLKEIAKKQKKLPLSNLPPVASLLAWLIVSHHRLPLLQQDNSNLKMEQAESVDDVLSIIDAQWGYENNYDEKEYNNHINKCFTFPKGLMSESSLWLSQIKKWSGRLLACENLVKESLSNGAYRLLLSQARLCLMLGDHNYSSKDADKNWKSGISLFANTDRKTKALKQKLDEHLVNVAKLGIRNAHLLPAFENELPDTPSPQSLKKLSPHKFRWQDKAVDKIKAFKKTNEKIQAYFVVNMASTGSGKTFANAKVMRALSADGDSLRFILALGLRTLTLQTGDEYRDRVGLDETELAVLIGSQAVVELHNQKNLHEKENSFENSGSISEEPLLDEDVDYDCEIPEEGLATVLNKKKDRQFLYAPVLACTIDHLMAAVQTARGGKYILPTLRLMSSDLIIDEIDDFSGSDLIAIGRLIHLAGVLGRKVMISSATIPPDLAEGYFKAYRDGWLLYCKARDKYSPIACAWIDEFTCDVSSNKQKNTEEAIVSYKESHQKFITQRVKKLETQPAKRKAEISECKEIAKANRDNPNDQATIQSKQQLYFDRCLGNALSLHEKHYTVDEKTNINVSFGVIRVANIKPCIALTQHLLAAECDNTVALRVMAYHSQQLLLLRHEQEQHLDAVLKRKEEQGKQPLAFSNEIIREQLDTLRQNQPSLKNLLFILVATPVEEVGRDHDFDWAVIEPSSYRSFIQLAGRVRRHRQSATEQPNIQLMQYNWLALKGYHKKGNIAFTRPGFEEKPLSTHDLTQLVDVEQIKQRLDAIPRIQKSQSPKPKSNLADLEHHVTQRLLTSYSKFGPASLQGYLNEPWFLTALPQLFNPFRAGSPNVKVYLIYDEYEEAFSFHEKNPAGEFINREKTLNISYVALTEQQEVRLWLKRSYQSSVKKIAAEKELSERKVSMRYGELSFLKKEGADYEYSDQLGWVEKTLR